MAASAALPSSPFPILTSVSAIREWRQQQFKKGLTVGFVPTMGALHSGHLSLVRESLARTDSTIVSIFVNPAQFAPHEDLSTYPRTLEADLQQLVSLHSNNDKGSSSGVAALFLPPIEALYPSGITTTVADQVGAFVEVKGLQDRMEGASRPGFFRGVATVVTKLFNLVQPDLAFFGQKDIQQCLLLRRMLLDLHTPYPLPRNLIIVPTSRDPQTDLALSSRNAYLTASERRYADVLIRALKEGENDWFQQKRAAATSPNKTTSGGGGEIDVGQVLEKATKVVEATIERVEPSLGIRIQLLYLSLNDPHDLHLYQASDRIESGRGGILSGAVLLGKTRLIDNLVFDFDLN